MDWLQLMVFRIQQNKGKVILCMLGVLFGFFILAAALTDPNMPKTLGRGFLAAFLVYGIISSASWAVRKFVLPTQDKKFFRLSWTEIIAMFIAWKFAEQLIRFI